VGLTCRQSKDFHPGGQLQFCVVLSVCVLHSTCCNTGVHSHQSRPPGTGRQRVERSKTCLQLRNDAASGPTAAEPRCSSWRGCPARSSVILLTFSEVSMLMRARLSAAMISPGLAGSIACRSLEQIPLNSILWKARPITVPQHHSGNSSCFPRASIVSAPGVCAIPSGNSRRPERTHVQRNLQFRVVHGRRYRPPALVRMNFFSELASPQAELMALLFHPARQTTDLITSIETHVGMVSSHTRVPSPPPLFSTREVRQINLDELGTPGQRIRLSDSLFSKRR